MITYRLPKHGHATVVAILLDKKQVGRIRREAMGWRYYPNGQKTGGDLFPTMRECQTEPKPQGGRDLLPPGVEYALVLPRSVILARYRNEQKLADIFYLGALMGGGEMAGAMRAQGRADVWLGILEELDRKTEGEKP